MMDTNIILKPRASLKKFLGEKIINGRAGRMRTTTDEYSNGYWVLTPEATPKKLQDKFDHEEASAKFYKKPDSTRLWKLLVNNMSNLQKLGSIEGYFQTDDHKIGYIIRGTKTGKKFGVLKIYYDYLKKHIPGFSLKTKIRNVGKNPLIAPLVIFSGDTAVGFLMPAIIAKTKIISCLHQNEEGSNEKNSL